ncbi:MAG TPA: bifunctional oligoribonuclease/PAP phosphatase NrnA [Phycisphaerae bacterium]|nr:bifunctional oligoribonuclease/PAP phosphatase NrnA [Phycisphaerae bacterium]
MAEIPRKIDLSAALARIEPARNIVITTHARADGDAIGSVAGLQRLLRRSGKAANGYLHEPISERYRFMGEIEPLKVWPADAASVINRADLFVVVDTCAAAQLDRLAPPVREAKVLRLAIDHHITRDAIVDEVFSDESAAAASLILLELAGAAGWPLDPGAATLLYTGLATDTGWFRFSNADARAYAAAAKLVGAGAKPNELYERIYLSEPPARARLMGAVLSSFELLANGRLAVIKLTRAMLAACGATPAMTEDLINEPQRVASVVAAVMFVEGEPGSPVRVNFRSKRDIDVAAIAASFGGGGHARAAGAKVAGSFEEVASRVTNALLEQARIVPGAGPL